MNLIDSEGGHRYEILTLLGQGGFGKVYRALDENGSDVAIKALDISVLLRTPYLKDRVNEEVRIHSKLSHPSILSFKNVFQDSAHVYIILEYCPHGDLAAHLRKHRGKPFDKEEVLSWFRQILSGIEYLHHHLIVHRDLTLANCLLDSGYNVKIGDFGLATQLSSKNEVHNTMCGTPISIAPEVVSRVPSDPGPADVWGLGCILYTLLIGTSPFETEGIRSTMKKVVSEEPHFPSSLSPEARDLLGKMLKKNPAQRISLKDVGNHPYVTGEKIKLLQTTTTSTSSWDSGIGGKSGFSVNTAPDVRRSFNNKFPRQRSWSDISTIPKVVAGDTYTTPSSLSVVSAPSSSSSSKAPVSLSSPLKAARLRPSSKKHALKVGTACILPSEDVQLEFSQKKDSSIETFVISPNGRSIDISSAKRKETHTYDLLPKKYWQKYNYAARYVKFVREKTPKITFWSEKAKFMLMENGPVASFEGAFYEHYDSLRVTFSSSSGIRIVSKCGRNLGSYNYPLSFKSEDPNGSHLRHFEEVHTRCKRIEDLLETNEGSIGGSSFPLTVGRKPTSEGSKPSTRQPMTSTSGLSNFSVRSDGIKSFFSDRTTRVDFEDDTRIELGPDDEIKYFKKGRLCPLSKFDLPPEVKAKLARIDAHIQGLRSNPS